MVVVEFYLILEVRSYINWPNNRSRNQSEAIKTKEMRMAIAIKYKWPFLDSGRIKDGSIDRK